MCGIAGYVQRLKMPDTVIEQMTNRLAHRGPDGQGIWRKTHGEFSVALGHRRLAIIDLAGGAQPLGNEDGSVQITFNGEIYNYRSLRENLESRGHRFATRSDTEVIVHHYEEHGPEGLRDLDGMFALAIWDSPNQLLLLARDRVGIKPLYYAPLSDGGIAFASELAALLQHPDVDREIDPCGIASLFFLNYIHAPRTIVRGARKLEPASYLIWRNGRHLAPQRFWNLGFEAQAATPDREEQLEDHLRIKLHAAVSSQLVSDVPVGVFLSGGIDSSIVAALAMQHAPRKLRTFTIRFDDPQFDESEFAREVAAHIGSEHVEETFSEAMLLASLDEALASLDEPMADASLLPTFALSRLAAKHVKVALGGDGGDELWAGYPTYKAHKLAAIYRWMPGMLRKIFINPIVRALPLGGGYQSLDWKAKRFALRWDDEPRLRHLRWMSGVDWPALRDALPSFANSQEQAWTSALQSRSDDRLNDILALDFSTYLPGAVLTKVDRASMAHGLEVRPPLLANELIDFAFSLPGECKMQGMTTKSLLKRAAADLLPARIVQRRKKGFAIPLARWLCTALRPRLCEIIQHSPLWDLGMLDRATFREWYLAHCDRRADHSMPLYALLVLDHWYRQVYAANAAL